MCLLPPPSLSLPALHVPSIPTVRLACPFAAHPARLPAAVSPPARCHTACLSTVRSPLPTSPCQYIAFVCSALSALHRGRIARALPPLSPANVLPSCRRLLRSAVCHRVTVLLSPVVQWRLPSPRRRRSASRHDASPTHCGAAQPPVCKAGLRRTIIPPECRRVRTVW